jgi:glycine/D-amino acid oxidase-like deaminating enzyme
MTPPPSSHDHAALAAGPDRTYWRATAAERSDPPLLGDRDADVVVVGGGIVGLSAALLAVEAGLDVVVLEARQLASGTTGGTTGKVTSQNGTRLRELRRRFGADGARRYAALTEGGIERLDELVDRHAIACDLEVAPAHLVSLSPGATGWWRRRRPRPGRRGSPSRPTASCPRSASRCADR